jgi:hypothetical protein
MSDAAIAVVVTSSLLGALALVLVILIIFDQRRF